MTIRSGVAVSMAGSTRDVLDARELGPKVEIVLMSEVVTSNLGWRLENFSSHDTT